MLTLYDKIRHVVFFLIGPYSLIMKLNLKIEDLIPRESAFKLHALEYPLHLKPWSVRVRFWALEKYGQKHLQYVLETQQLKELCEIAYFMLKEKEQFKTFEEFADAIASPMDIINLAKAIMGSIGFGEKEIRDIEKSGDSGKPKPQAKKRKPTGVRSLTK